MFPVDQMASTPRIFINPNFNKIPPTHINPNFLRSQMIHINPNFLPKDSVRAPQVQTSEHPIQNKQLQEQNATVVATTNAPQLLSKIISKSRTKIVRVPMKPVPVPSASISSPSPLIKIGLRKLIRTSTTDEPKIQTHAISTNAARARYKVDRRVLAERNPVRARKTSFTGRYALRRSSESLSARTISRFVKRNSEALNFSKIVFRKMSSSSKNLRLQLLNINGVLYKSTKTKLERNDAKKEPHVSSKVHLPKKAAGERAIFVRGTKYLLDRTGFNLTREATANHTSTKKSLRRIDIGGLTYVANSKNVLVRTDTHLTRNHVSSAKQKSIHLLSRRFVKTNIPCPIYQRVGKCAAFESGKCMKVHDKMHVAICSRFLRGECLSSTCLLSHNVSLSKMPVCKFFLQGCCVREDCPYLHKKLSAKAEVCMDFLKGFCGLAQECNKRHEFVCPNMEAKGKCDKVKCFYCRKHKMQLTKKMIKHSKTVNVADRISHSSKDLMPSIVESEDVSVSKRYFASDSAETDVRVNDSEPNDSSSDDESNIDEEMDSTGTVSRRKRPQLGTLPAFIPFT